MKKQIGLIKVQGTLDGVTFYQSDGENRVRMAKGPSKERIMTDPAFKRTRENISEFTGSTKAGKACREALLSTLRIADRQITARIFKAVRKIHGKGKGVRGQRTIDISAYKKELEGIEINRVASFGAVFKIDYRNEITADRNASTVTTETFVPAESLYPEKGVTHFRLVHSIGTVSDYGYNKETSQFEPREAGLNMLSAISYSEYYPVDATDPVIIFLQAVLPDSPALTASVSLLGALGIIFYQEIDGVYYPMKQGNAMQIIAVN